MKKITTLFALLSISISSVATVISSGPISLSDKRIQITADPYTARVYVIGVEMDYAALGCENNGAVIPLGENYPQGEMMYNTLLSAKKAGQNVRLEAKSCWDAYSVPVIFSIHTY